MPLSRRAVTSGCAETSEEEGGMKIAVVGIGGTGSAACRHLAKAGHTVVGYERFALGHDRGSSHGESRIIRYTYPDLLYTQMMADAYALWADLEAEAGEELFVRCGGLYFGAEDDPRMQITERSLIEAGLPYDRLRPKEAQERFSPFRFQPHEVALFQKESGLLRSTRCVLANARLARQHGAVLLENTLIEEIVSDGAQVMVKDEKGREEVFDRVLVTAGAWMGQLLRRLALTLKVTRQQVLYFDVTGSDAAFQPERFPVWIDATANYYGFPADGRIPGVKLASHTLGQEVDPNEVSRTVDPAYVAETRAYAARRLPDLTGNVTHGQVCLYTSTPNEDFILDQVPDTPNVWMVSGCSGHGFKFTVLLGKIAASLVTGETYARDLSRFSLSHFLGRLPD